MRLLRSWWLGIGAAVALGVTATVAVGQGSPPPPNYPECTRKPTPQDIEGAKGAHNAATQFYERAEYDKAIRYWNDALAFDCTAVGLLKNIANAYEKLGDRASTVSTLETYLKRTGPDPVLEQKVKNLRALMQATPPPTASASATASAPPTATGSVPPINSANLPQPEGQRPFGYTPWAVVGGGGALAVVGAILLPIGLSNIATAEKACPPPNRNGPNCTPDLANQGNTGRAEGAAGVGLLVVGLAAAGGGLAWQFVFNKPKPGAAAPAPGQAPPPAKTSLSVSPVAGPGQSGVVVKGTF